jgi:hypothetical protein
VWPANDALHGWTIGRLYTIHTKTGDRLTGRLAMQSSELVVLVSACGAFNVKTGSILRIDNH